MDKKLLGLVSVFLLFFGVFMSLVVFEGGERQFRIRATASNPSCENSFVFASNVDVAAAQSVSIIAYIRDTDNEGLSGVPVTCETNLGALVPGAPITTDKDGTARMLLSSTTPGIATISCRLPTCSIPQGVTVQFNP